MNEKQAQAWFDGSKSANKYREENEFHMQLNSTLEGDKFSFPAPLPQPKNPYLEINE